MTKTGDNFIITVPFDKGSEVITTDVTLDFSKLISFCYKNLF